MHVLGTEGSGLTGDAALADRLVAQLERELRLDPETLRAHAEGGRVRLEGEVRTREDRRRACEIARAFDGVEEVDDRLQVASSEPRDVQPDPHEQRR